MKRTILFVIASFLSFTYVNANSLQILNLTTYTFTQIQIYSYDPLNPNIGCNTTPNSVDIVPGMTFYQDPSAVPGSSCPSSYKFQGIYGFCNPIDIAVQTPDFPIPPVQSTQDFPAGTACWGGATFTMQFSVNAQGDGAIVIW